MFRHTDKDRVFNFHTSCEEVTVRFCVFKAFVSCQEDIVSLIEGKGRLMDSKLSCGVFDGLHRTRLERGARRLVTSGIIIPTARYPTRTLRMTMAWSNTATLSDSTYQDRWRNFFDNHLDGLTGWTVGTHPVNSSASRILRYDYTDAHDSSSQSYYYWYSGSSTLYEDSTYTSTPQDLATDTSSNSSMYSSTTAGAWKVWTSSNDTDSIIVTSGKVLIWMWLKPSSIFNPVKSSWDGSTDRPDPILFPVTSNASQRVANWGQTGTTTTEADACPDVAQGTGNAYVQPASDLFYTTWGISASDYGYPPFVRYSMTDTLVHVPGNGPGSAGDDEMIAAVGALVFDGTDYYLRTDSDLSHAAYMFNMGTSEPTF